MPSLVPDAEKRQPWLVWLLLVPLVFGGMALRTNSIVCKLAVPVCCALLLLARSRFGRCWVREHTLISTALGFSLCGDFFLSGRQGRISWFLAGIGAFLLAHVAYVLFSLRQGRFRWGVFAGLLAPFLCLYQFTLLPGIQGGPMQAGVLAYLVVSCASLAAATGLRNPPEERLWFQTGIALIVFSDTIIGLSEFGNVKALSWLILPTYYLALVCITLSCLMRPEHRTSDQPAQLYRAPVGRP